MGSRRTRRNSPRAASADAARRRTRNASVLLSAALIVVVGLAIYSNSFNGLFVLDEQTAIVDNPNIRLLSTAFTAPPDVGLGGRPVASLSFALNYALAPADARDAFTPPPPGYPPEAWSLLYRNLWGYHAANLAIHLLAGLTLFGLVRRTLLSPRLATRFAGAATPLALSTALLWLAHPVQTSSITYVAQRVESMMALFFLLTMYCAIRAWDGRRAAWSAAAIVSCFLGAATKEVIVVAPLLVLLWDRLFASDRPRWRFYAALASSWILIAILVATSSHGSSMGFGVKGWSAWLYLTTQAGVIVHYFAVAFLVSPTVLDYEWPAAASLTAVLPQALLLAALAALTAWGVVRRNPLAFLGAWFFLILGPSSSILPIPTEVAADHRLYLPIAAIVTGVVIGAYSLIGKSEALRPYRTASLAVVAILVVALGVLTYQRNDDYASDERIWADTVAKRPSNSRAHVNYAAVLVQQQRFAEAERHLRTALSIHPDYAEAHVNLGAALCSQGRLDEGIEHFRRAAVLQPDYRDAYRNLGEALAVQGRSAEAIAAFAQARKTAPDDVVLMNKAGWLLATAPQDDARNGDQAISLARRAVELSGGRDVDSLDTLAAGYAETGRFAEATSAAERALALAESRGLTPLLPGLQYRLNLYRAGQKYREPLR